MVCAKQVASINERLDIVSKVSEDQWLAKDDKTLDDTVNEIDQVNPQRRRAQLESIIKSHDYRTSRFWV